MTQFEQNRVCEKYGVGYMESKNDLKVGIARNVKEGILPINGLRHEPEEDTTGWYIWAGEEFSEGPNSLYRFMLFI